MILLLLIITLIFIIISIAYIVTHDIDKSIVPSKSEFIASLDFPGHKGETVTFAQCAMDIDTVMQLSLNLLILVALFFLILGILAGFKASSRTK